MCSSSAPAITGDSLLNSNATSAPRRRGRPRIHENDSAKKAAYRARLRVKRDHKEKRTLRRDFSRLFATTKGRMRTRVYPDGFRSEFLAPTPAEQKLLNKILCSLGLGMTNGEFLKGAPAGCGQLVSGGYGSDKSAYINDKRKGIDEEEEGGQETIELADGRIVPLKCGHRVEPEGWGSHKDEQTGSIQSQYAGKKRVPADETDKTFINKTFKDESTLACYVEGCRRLVWGVRTIKGREVYHCDEHAPISEAA